VPVFKLADTNKGRSALRIRRGKGWARPQTWISCSSSPPVALSTSMACRRDGIIPPEIDIMAIHMEATPLRQPCLGAVN
jgi:hypothetical protein